MARFRVAQISDLHLCTEPDWVTPYDEGSITDAVAASYDTLLGNRSNRGRFLPNAYPSSFSSDLAAALLKHLIPKIPYQKAPIRRVRVLSYDMNKYATIQLPDGQVSSVKWGYLYSQPGRCGEVRTINRRKLERMLCTRT